MWPPSPREHSLMASLHLAVPRVSFLLPVRQKCSPRCALVFFHSLRSYVPFQTTDLDRNSFTLLSPFALPPGLIRENFLSFVFFFFPPFFFARIKRPNLSVRGDPKGPRPQAFSVLFPPKTFFVDSWGSSLREDEVWFRLLWPFFLLSFPSSKPMPSPPSPVSHYCCPIVKDDNLFHFGFLVHPLGLALCHLDGLSVLFFFFSPMESDLIRCRFVREAYVWFIRFPLISYLAHYKNRPVVFFFFSVAPIFYFVLF